MGRQVVVVTDAEDDLESLLPGLAGCFVCCVVSAILSNDLELLFAEDGQPALLLVQHQATSSPCIVQAIKSPGKMFKSSQI